MANQERNFYSSPKDVLFGIASKFTGKHYQRNRWGEEEAFIVLQNQHKEVMPEITGLQLFRDILRKPQTVRLIGQMAVSALDQDNYPQALYSANYACKYAETDYMDCLGGGAIEIALKVHRIFAEKIREAFFYNDPFLKRHEGNMLVEINDLRRQENHMGELVILREMVHSVALNGTLGEEAKRFFDPFALLDVRRSE